MARTISLQGVTTPRHAEILAISLELDVQEVMHAILNGKENLAIDGHMLDGVKAMLRKFSMVTCSYVPRDCN